MKKILVSACLLGSECRYDGKSNRTEGLTRLLDEFCSRESLFRIVPVCPEVLGGLSIPRECAERLGSRVITQTNRDVTAQFLHGAGLAFRRNLETPALCAILKARSPSCGHKTIYDGTFTHTVIQGNGVFAQILEEAGVRVFSEEELPELREFLEANSF